MNEETFMEKAMNKTYKYSIKKSSIHGKGTFAKKKLKRFETIGIAITIDNSKHGERKYARTPLGRYINDSSKPNTYLIRKGNKILVKAKKNVCQNEELVSDYSEAQSILGIKIKHSNKC